MMFLLHVLLTEGYADAGASWRQGYDTADNSYDFRDNLESLYAELKPFYKQVGHLLLHIWSSL